MLDMWKLNGIDHEETVRRIVNFNRKHKIGKLNMDMAFSDYEFNILKYEMPCEQIPFSRHPERGQPREVREHPRRDDVQLCRASEARSMRGRVRPHARTETAGCALSWRKDRQGRLLVTPKDDLRVLLKMSTDILDAAALSCVELTNIDDPVIKDGGNDMDEDEIERMMDEHKFPAFENEDVFAMCVRLRRARRITRELDDMIGTVLFAIVRLAVAINLRRADAYLEEVCRDVGRADGKVVLMLLDKIDTDAKTENPHALINYLLGVAIARFKVVRRNRANRQRLRPTKLMSEICNDNRQINYSIEYSLATCSDIDGKTIFKH